MHNKATFANLVADKVEKVVVRDERKEGVVQEERRYLLVNEDVEWACKGITARIHNGVCRFFNKLY